MAGDRQGGFTAQPNNEMSRVASVEPPFGVRPRASVPLSSGSTMCSTIAAFVILVMTLPARGQYLGCVNLERVNRRLSGPVVDYTTNHGSDRRIYSTVLGTPRDLYVYLPPGYDPSHA